MVAEREQLTWNDLRWVLQVAGPSNTSLPPTTSVAAWAEWGSQYSVPVRFRGRDGWRSIGPLDSILKRMASALQREYRAPASVFGFVPHRSTFSAAQAHIGAESALVIDLKDFFGQINESRVRFALGDVLDNEALNVLVGCCLRTSSLPLGFRTSPVISNFVFQSTDLAIHALCLSRDVSYTRWVDDLVFSGSAVDDLFLGQLLEILSTFSWEPNGKKTRFMSSRRVVLGLNIAKELERPHVPRTMKKELRKQVYYLNKFGGSHFSHPGSWPLSKILGTIAYIKSVDPNLAMLMERQLDALPHDDKLVSYSRAVGGGRWQLDMLDYIGFTNSSS